MSKRNIRNLIFAACVLSLLAVLTSGCSDHAAASAAASPSVTETAATAAAATPLPTPAPSSPAPSATPEPEKYSGPDLDERPKTEDSFFGDAAFFGNSLVDGLRMFGGIEKGDFYAMTSASVVSVGLTKNFTLADGTPGTLLQALGQKQYRKVYVLLGINEIGFDTDYFIQLYGGVLDAIASEEPKATIYIMSLTPVTAKKSGEGELFSMERVTAYNDALRALAAKRGCYYVDLVAALAGDDGYLPAGDSSDGIHLCAEKYAVWADWLRTHYA